MTHPAESPQASTPPAGERGIAPLHFVQHVEVINADRAEAYKEIAREIGGISIDTIAKPGDTVVVDEAINNGYRHGNPRDKGDLAEVITSEGELKKGVLRREEIQAEKRSGAKSTLKDILVKDGQEAVLVTRPARHSPDNGRQVSNFNMQGFYRATKARTKIIKDRNKAA